MSLMEDPWERHRIHLPDIGEYRSDPEGDTLNNTVLVSLAILKTNWEQERKDYLENFVPLVIESVRNLSDPFTVHQVQSALRADFGLQVPQNVITSLLQRLRRRGFVTCIDRESYSGIRPRLQSSTFRTTQASVLEAHRLVIEDMLRYLEGTFGVKWTSEEAEGHLASYLQDKRLIIQGVSSGGTLVVGTVSSSRRDRYLICSYIDHLHANDPEKYKYFDTVLKGNFLANAVFLPEPAEAQRRFRDTSIFFDTPFLMSALGWAGRTRRAPCLELLDLLYETGARLSCFRHTVSEIERILDACAHRLSLGRSASAAAGNKTDEYFISAGYGPADIAILQGQIERRLSSLRISVVDPPEYSSENMPLAEDELAAYLRDSVKYQNPLALEHDVRCLSAVLRLRKGREYLRAEDCRALFVTTNVTLAGATMRYFYRSASSAAISPVITDTTLTNLLWLKKPFAAPDLPRKRLIADCFAAAQPSDELWAAYVAQIEHLKEIGEITPEDYYILRHSHEAKSEMMRLTLGDEDAFEVGKVSEILASIKLKSEKALRDRLESSELERLSVERKLAAALAFETSIYESIRRKANSLGRAAYRLSLTAIVTLLAAGCVVGIVQMITNFGPVSVTLTVLVGAAEIFSLWSIASGTSVPDWARSLEVKVSRAAQTWMLRQLTQKTETPSDHSIESDD